MGRPMDNRSIGSGAAGGTGVPEDFAVVIDARLRVMAWSSGAQALSGHAPDDVVGRPVAELLAADLPDPAGRRFAAGRPSTSEVALRHRDGDRILVRLCGTPLSTGGTGALWLVTGATVTHASGPHSADAAELWDRTLAQLPLPVAVYDHRNRFVACNEVMSQAMGMSSEEMEGLTLTEIQSSNKETDRLQREVLRTGEPIHSEQQSGRGLGEADEHAWSAYLTPLKDPDGSVHGLSALVIDTTEQCAGVWFTIGSVVVKRLRPACGYVRNSP